MNEHRGEIVRQKIKDFQIGFENLADDLSISPQTLFRWLKQEKLPLSKIQRIAIASKIDFTNDFPELKESEAINSKLENADYKQKYFEILEKYSVLQEAAVKYGFGSETGQKGGKEDAK